MQQVTTLLAFEPEGHGDPILILPRQAGEVRGAARVPDHDHELVAAEPRQAVVDPEVVADPPSDRLEQLVAHFVTEAVVHVPEA